MRENITCLMIFMSLFASELQALDQTETGFFYPIGKASFDQECGTWLGRDSDNGGCYFDGFYHNGVDMMTNSLDADVYAIADGKIYKRHCDDDSWGVGNCALFIEHETHDGQVFTGLYGHLSRSSLPVGNDVYAGKSIGKTGDWCCGTHLHFGVFLGITPPSTVKGLRGWGMMANSQWNSSNNFIDPIAFIQNNFAFNPSSERQTRCQGDICWEPVDVSCDQATSRYQLLNPPYAQAVGAEACNKLQTKLEALAANPNPREEVPENSVWQRWWRAFLNFFGGALPAQAAEEIQQFGTINTINVYTGTVVAGNASKASYGTGKGYQTVAVDPTQPDLPDFITTKVWLTTPWQEEAYTYGQSEKMQMHAQFKNIGESECSGTIMVHFYLSQGYKEDAHSDWKRVGTDEIKCENLKPGQTHSEEEGIELWRDIPEPGIWNITAYIDHPRDDHNHGGDHAEKHESNNGSTEAVFEVTADGQVVNVAPPPPQPDLIAHDFAAGSVFRGDPATFVYWIRNQGQADAPETFTALEVYANGSWVAVASSNRVRADHATAGHDHYEAVKTDPITLPPGAYSARVRADDGNRAAESDEDNNVLQGTLTVTTRPKPKLVITRFEDQKGCCTTNTGEYLYPDIWIRNDGPVAPAGNVRVLYQVHSPVGTGGAYQTIGYGTIEPRELQSGDTDEDYMDGNRWQIPKSGAWKKQWHTVRACVNQEGGEPTCGPGDSVATYARYSKK
jgi:hypothetical protein